MADKTNNIIYRIEVDSKSGKLNIDGVTKSFEQADRAFLKLQKDVAKGLPKATKEVNQLRSASGGATTSVLELGRVVSDAPYGIRGMANNVSQLASNMLFTSQQIDKTTGKAIGFKGVLKDMGKSFMGPLGVLFAIQAVVAALDFFFGAATKASSGASDYAESLVSLRKTMDDLNISQDDLNDKIEDYIVLSDLKNKLDKSQEDSTERLKEIEEDLVSIREDNAKKQKKLLLDMTVAEYEALSEEEKIAHRRATKSVDFDKRFKQLKKNIKEEGNLETEKRLIISQSLDIQKEYNDAKKKFNSAEEGTLQALKNAKKEKEKERELLSKTSEDYKRLTIAIDEYQKKIEEIEGKKTKGGSKAKKISPFKTPKELQIDIKNAENAIIQYEKKIEDARLKEEFNEKMSTAKTEEEKEKIRRTYQRDRLLNQIKAEKLALELKKKTEIENVKLKTSNHKADLKRIYDKYIFELSLNKKLSDEEKKKLKDEATGKFGIANIQATGEENISIQEITDKYTPLFSLFQKLSDARLSALFSMPSKEGKKDDTDEEDGIDFAIEQYKILQSGLTDFLSGEYDRQMTIEQNKTNAMNNQLRERLNNENLSAGERKNIQLQIARNDEELRKKQEKIEKKRFKMQKAINIANGLVDVYSSGIKAYGSQLIIGDPSSPLRAQIAQGVALAAGMANIAMIARQKFQSSAGATVPAGALGSGGSGSGTGDRSFDFNLAGASRENQLAQTLQGRFDQPLQAYVVSRDITNQQQLDEDIRNNASFG